MECETVGSLDLKLISLVPDWDDILGPSEHRTIRISGFPRWPRLRLLYKLPGLPRWFYMAWTCKVKPSEPTYSEDENGTPIVSCGFMPDGKGVWSVEKREVKLLGENGSSCGS